VFHYFIFRGDKNIDLFSYYYIIIIIQIDIQVIVHVLSIMQTFFWKGNTL